MNEITELIEILNKYHVPDKERLIGILDMFNREYFRVMPDMAKGRNRNV